MFKSNLFKSKSRLVLILSMSVTQVMATEPSVDAWLSQADSYRLTADSMRVEISVDLFKDNVLDKKHHYRVYTKPNRRSLVIFKSASELGQKVLMKEDKFYLFMPQSRRAIRITPMQKLLGDASTGDIATMTWSGDYSATLLSETEQREGVACVLLALLSKRKGTTYGKIHLYLAQSNYAPVFAKLYLASGKLAKSAKFILGEMNGVTTVTVMVLFDQIKLGRKTEIHYTEMTPVEIPNKYYNPQYLARNVVE